MRHFSETASALSSITDPGMFEHLAVAVLRRAAPALYANLTQPGVNAEGKAVKAPIDAVSFVRGSNPPHMVTVHHTICAQNGLRKKWLHDPQTVKSRRGGSPSAPAGDVVKTGLIASAERVRTPNVRVTLALTTNEEPPEEVTRDAEVFARRSGIDLDIWSRSRIADYLDHSPEGQWLRKQYLGIEQERLSVELLQTLSIQSLDAYRPPAQEDALVERDIVDKLANELSRPVGFVVGESGYGKSVAAFQLLQAHVKCGGCGFILPHNLLESSLTLDQAIDATLRQFHPVLEPGCGAIARSLCSAGTPLLILVEDISRSGQSTALIERLDKWAVVNTNDKDSNHASWRIVCPLWPQLFTALGDEARKRVETLVMQFGPYTREEARNAIQRRAAIEGLNILPLDVAEIAKTLGFDPLLIALHDLGSVPNPTQVIAKFITQSAERLEWHGGTHSAYEYEATLRVLAREMLQRRCIDPSWSQVFGRIRVSHG